MSGIIYSFPWTSPLVEQDVINKLHDLFQVRIVSFLLKVDSGIQQLVMSGGDDQPEEMSAEWVRTRDLPLTWTRKKHNLKMAQGNFGAFFFFLLHNASEKKIESWSHVRCGSLAATGGL